MDDCSQTTVQLFTVFLFCFDHLSIEIDLPIKNRARVVCFRKLSIGKFSFHSIGKHIFIELIFRLVFVKEQKSSLKIFHY